MLVDELRQVLVAGRDDCLKLLLAGAACESGNYVVGFDPVASKLNRIPSYDPERARIYREQAGSLMRLWRTLFGFGSLVFGMSVTIAFGVVEYYLWFRLVVLNAIFYGYLRPRQRRASIQAFRSMGVPT